MRTVKIGNAQGFWGDQPSAPSRLMQQEPSLDYLTLDYLSEVSLSIMAIQREKDPLLGYARDFIEVIKSLAPLWKKGSKTRLICNAGGLNPRACAAACAEALRNAGCAGVKIGIISGDDVLSIVQATPSNTHFNNLETGKPISTIANKLITANAYMGAMPLVKALQQGAQIVIGGRIADPSLTVAACIHEFGWSPSDYHKLAGATVAGHLIECGTQVTGGISNRWLEFPDSAHIGFPIAEIDEMGDLVITKPAKTGGAVTLETVKEQLLYEIGDPGNYLSPDVTVSFLGLKLEQQSQNRVRVSGAIGSAPPATYKVSACYRAGFRAEAMLTVVGHDAVKKARCAGQAILQRLTDAGSTTQESVVECLGCGDAVLGVMSSPEGLIETVLRVAVADPRHEVVEAFTKEMASLVTSGPPGCTGYATGRPKVRPVFGYWPCLISPTELSQTTEILEVS